MFKDIFLFKNSQEEKIVQLIKPIAQSQRFLGYRCESDMQ